MVRSVFFRVLVALPLVLFAGCVTTQSVDAQGGWSTTTAASVAEIPVDTPIAYKEISGFWIGIITGRISDFYLKDVQISGQVFTAAFFLKSTGRLSCSVDEKIKGTYIEGVFRWEMEDSPCEGAWHYRATITTSPNVSDWKGSYFVPSFWRPAYGWYIVKNVIK